MPKFVASRTLRQPTWNRNGAQRTPRHGGEGTKGPRRDILKFGTGVMDAPLIEHGLVGEFHFLDVPVVAGSDVEMLR